ncbi:MAG: DNA-3-methyladenine glycosylase 2 family protein [Marmoricola sp.]|nr:DNA-3-methyladenine glycosylase 2 family protein [Marmoricola sp.]
MAGFTISPQGAFELKESVEFGFGQRHSEKFQGVMRMAFCLDGYAEQVGVVLRQDDPDGSAYGAVQGEVHGDADPASVEGQVARILSLDHDGRPYEQIGDRDPVIGRLLALRPGLRPPLFHSPYEAALWAVIATRRSTRSASTIRDRLARDHGRVFELAGREVAAVPTPEALLGIDEVEGLAPDRVRRLHGIARFALDGGLDAERLLAMGPDAARDWLQQLEGIGPFYASLIVLRATGFTDVLVDEEPRLRALVQRLYGLDHEPDPDQLAAIAEPWRPRRTWAAVLVRAAGPGSAAA